MREGDSWERENFRERRERKGKHTEKKRAEERERQRERGTMMQRVHQHMGEAIR